MSCAACISSTASCSCSTGYTRIGPKIALSPPTMAGRSREHTRTVGATYRFSGATTPHCWTCLSNLRSRSTTTNRTTVVTRCDWPHLYPSSMPSYKSSSKLLLFPSCRRASRSFAMASAATPVPPLQAEHMLEHRLKS